MENWFSDLTFMDFPVAEALDMIWGTQTERNAAQLSHFFLLESFTFLESPSKLN